MKRTASEIFREVVHGNNFITPEIISYHHITNGAAELSKGRGILTPDPLYGVTVVQNGAHDYDKSTVFYSEQDARDYIATLKKDSTLC